MQHTDYITYWYNLQAARLYICVVPTVCLKLRGTCPQNDSSVEAYKSLRGSCVHGHVVYAYDVSPVLALSRRRVTTLTSVTRYDLAKRYTALALRP
jgi:hypothetical protein